MRQQPVQFGVRKLAAIVVIFAAMFAVFRGMETSGLVIACVEGVCLSGILVLGKVPDIVPCLRVVGGCVAGVLLAGMCCVSPFYHPSQGIGVFCIGAGVGGMVMTVFNAVRRERK